MKPKERIIEFLKKDGEKSTSEICQETTINYYKILKLLKDLEKENKIAKNIKNNFTYWRMKK